MLAEAEILQVVEAAMGEVAEAVEVAAVEEAAKIPAVGDSHFLQTQQ